MSDAMRNLRNRLTGLPDKPIDQPEQKMNPMMLGLMKSFGLSPDTLLQYAEQIKTAVLARLSSIDDHLAAINAKLDTLEMKTAEIEANQRVILERLKDPNEEQFAQMAEHPLSSRVTDEQIDTPLTITEQ
jgi:hypothetical protein